jgi:hypothetical protein
MDVCRVRRVEPVPFPSKAAGYRTINMHLLSGSGLVDRRVCSTVYTNVCKTYHTITVYATIFLKMNPRV